MEYTNNHSVRMKIMSTSNRSTNIFLTNHVWILVKSNFIVSLIFLIVPFVQKKLNYLSIYFNGISNIYIVKIMKHLDSFILDFSGISSSLP